jgi:hypothetical protein
MKENYTEKIRTINLKNGRVQFLAPQLAENTPFLEKHGFKIDDPDYFAWLNKSTKEEVKEEVIIEFKAQINEETKDLQIEKVKPKRKTKKQ